MLSLFMFDINDDGICTISPPLPLGLSLDSVGSMNCKCPSNEVPVDKNVHKNANLDDLRWKRS